MWSKKAFRLLLSLVQMKKSNILPANPGSPWSYTEHKFKVTHEEASKIGSHVMYFEEIILGQHKSHEGYYVKNGRAGLLTFS